MVVSFFLLNNQGLTVSSANADYYSKKFGLDLESIMTSIYTELKLNYPDQLEINQIEQGELMKGLFGYYYITNRDLYFVFSDEKLTKDQIFENLQIKIAMNYRNTFLDFFKGIVLVNFEDIAGPVPYYKKFYDDIPYKKSVPLHDDIIQLLAVQATTLLGMGRLEKMPDNLVGPIPVPMNEDYNFVTFGYLRKAGETNDKRIEKKGRPTIVVIILDRSSKINKELADFLEVFMLQWSRSESAQKAILEETDLDRFYRNVKDTIALGTDLIAIRDERQNQIKKLVQQYYMENLLLKTELEELKRKLADFKGGKHKKSPKKSISSNKSSSKPKKPTAKKKSSKKVSKKKTRKKIKKSSKKK